MRYLEPLEDRRLFASYAAATVPELIAAINAANASVEGDTISLAARAKFSLTAWDNGSNGGNGLPQVTDPGGLTIIGGAATVERSAATGTVPFRLFDVAPGGSLTLRNLTLQGGLAAASQGGAIYNGGTLALDGVTVQNNVARGAALSPGAPGSDANGGGLFSSGVLTVAGSTFLNNQAVGGRGADFFVVRTADYRYIIPASAGGNGCGGGVYIAAGTASISASTFTGNVAAGGDGGSGFYSDDPAHGGNGFGGGLFVAGRPVALRAVTVTGNIARGGLKGVEDAAPGDGIGGGIYILDRTRANLDDFTVSHVLDNTASTSSPNIAGSYKRLR